MGSFLVAGGILFWAIFAFCIIVMYLGTANESFLIPLVMLGVLGWLFWQTDTLESIRAYMPQKWWQWILAAIAYSAIGAGWSVYHWYDHYKDRVAEVRAEKEEFFQHDWIKKLPPAEQQQRWEDHVNQSLPDVQRYKGRIMVWIAYWPLDVLHYIIGDLLFDWFNAIYTWMAEIYERIAAHLRKDL